MNHTPVIGIISACHDHGGILPVYGTNAHYPEQTIAAGAIPLQIPLHGGLEEEDLKQLISCCDGFLLPGGPDFDPTLYGEEWLPGFGAEDDDLDIQTQRAALRFVQLAVESGKPVLGICLGMQVINIAMGGSLWQDIPTQVSDELKHRNPMNCTADRWHLAHSVQLKEGSLICRLSGAKEIDVNSFHHQAVKAVAPGFHVTACAADGIAEAMEHETAPVLAVQWHPENLAHAGMPEAQNLFRWLAETASAQK